MMGSKGTSPTDWTDSYFHTHKESDSSQTQTSPYDALIQEYSAPYLTPFRYIIPTPFHA